MTGLSAREQNQLKRKLKQAGKDIPKLSKRPKADQNNAQALKVRATRLICLPYSFKRLPP